MKRIQPEISGNSGPGKNWRIPLKVAGIYALVAGLWIALSDRVLLWIFPSAEQFTLFQTLKGWVFVFASALMLVWLVRRDMAALQAEVNACEATQESFRALVETIPHGIQECDPQGIITFTSAGYDKVFGLEPGEAVGTAIWDRGVDKKDRLRLKAYLVKLVAKQPAPTPFVTRNRTKDGCIIDVQVDWDYLRDKQGGVTGFASIITDITERRRAEDAIRTSDRLKSELISTAAHEFRTPLTTIQGFSEILLSGHELAPEEKKEYLTYIYEKSLSLTDMVANLLDLSRIEEGKQIPMSFAPCSVAEVVREVSPFLKTLSARHRVEVMLEDERTLLAADRGKIGQVLESLLSNAVKYSRDGSAIRLRGSPLGGKYRLEVADEGIGMTEEQVVRMFERFYRVDNSDSSPSGLGIGMAIVKHIVDEHRGQIQVKSKPGAGTTVSFDLPISTPGSSVTNSL